MASPKSYKNVYTILEKVKKGEIETHYKEKDGLFGFINGNTFEEYQHHSLHMVCNKNNVVLSDIDK